jgi:hypothetical protein
MYSELKVTYADGAIQVSSYDISDVMAAARETWVTCNPVRLEVRVFDSGNALNLVWEKE